MLVENDKIIIVTINSIISNIYIMTGNISTPITNPPYHHTLNQLN